MFPPPHIISTKWTLKYFVIHLALYGIPPLYGIKKTFENFIDVNFLCQGLKYPIFSQDVGGPFTPLHMTTKTRKFNEISKDLKAYSPSSPIIWIYTCVFQLSKLDCLHYFVSEAPSKDENQKQSSEVF